jgi:hypothetical protein
MLIESARRMGVKVSRRRLREALERSVAVADRGKELPVIWVQRTEHIGESPSKTMIAVLGNALLARATLGALVDPRSIKARSGPRGFSARGTVSVLVAGARDFGYDLGVNKPEPLNNQPWFHAERVDEISPEEVRAPSRTYLRTLKAYLKDIDSISAEEAECALAAFIDSRRQVADRRRIAASEDLRAATLSLPRLARIGQSFIDDDAEAGRRGQALVAAALQCVLPRVELGGIHDPDPFDVIAFRKKADSIPSPVVQVKQKVVGEEAAIDLAEAAMRHGSTTALLAAIAKGQPPLDDRAIAASTEELGVILLTVTSVVELLSALAVFSSRSPEEIVERLPSVYEAKLREIGVDEDAIVYWEELVEVLVAV